MDGGWVVGMGEMVLYEMLVCVWVIWFGGEFAEVYLFEMEWEWRGGGNSMMAHCVNKVCFEVLCDSVFVFEVCIVRLLGEALMFLGTMVITANTMM